MHRFKSSRFALGSALALSLFGIAAVAQASTLSQAQIQAITSLLQAFNVDASTIANVQNVLENPATSTGSTSGESGTSSTFTQATSTGCAVLSTNLQLGSTDQSTGGEVSHLQSFLGKDKSVYPEDLVTGYFGSSTERAVKRWQANHGIVSSGDSETTGYGHVGPKTRGEMDKEMEMECEQGDTQNGSSNEASSTEAEHSSQSDRSGGRSDSHATSTQSEGGSSGE